MVTAVMEQGYRRSVSSERLNPNDARHAIDVWLLNNSSLTGEELGRVSEFRLSDEQRAFLANPVTEEPLIATIEGLDDIRQLSVFDSYSKKNTFSAAEKREYLGCVGEWLRHYREMHFYTRGFAPERHLEAEGELDGNVREDLKLQEKSLGFYLLAHQALDLSVDYPGSAGLIKAIEENREKLRPIYSEFEAMKAKISGMKSRGESVSSKDFELSYDSYVSAKKALDGMPHETLWILEHVRPLLDSAGNTLFSAGCAKMFHNHYVFAMGQAYRRERGISPKAKGRGYSAEVEERLGERSDKYFVHLVGKGISKGFRAMFNTFCFLEE